MRPQPIVQAASLLCSPQEAVRPVPAGSYREAHRQLCRIFEGTQSLALLHSNGQSGAAYLIDQFLAGIADDVAVVRLRAPCRDGISGMGEIIRGIGFDPTGLSLTDLENVFTLFLSFQKKHGRRTIVCMEAVQGCGGWVQNTVCRMVALEAAEHFGLMILMAGHTGPDGLLKRSMLDALSTESRQDIYLAPFVLAETREFLRWRVESKGTVKIAKVLTFDAVTRIHEVTEGEPDAVSSLFTKCLQLARETDSAPINVALVNRAHVEIELPSAPAVASEELNPPIVDQIDPRGGRLVVRLGDDVVQEHKLDRGHVLIGRGKLCDVRIASPSVSRHHALVIGTSTGAVLVDLESTNGTFVDGRRVTEHVLEASGVIAIGDCNIDYVGNDNRQGWTFDVRSADQSEPYGANFATRKLHTCRGELDGNAIKGNINRKGDKIYHVPGTSKYAATKIDESKGERWFVDEHEAIAAGWRAPRNCLGRS